MSWEIIGTIVSVIGLFLTIFLEWPRLKGRFRRPKGPQISRKNYDLAGRAEWGFTRALLLGFVSLFFLGPIFLFSGWVSKNELLPNIIVGVIWGVFLAAYIEGSLEGKVRFVLAIILCAGLGVGIIIYRLMNIFQVSMGIPGPFIFIMMWVAVASISGFIGGLIDNTF